MLDPNEKKRGENDGKDFTKNTEMDLNKVLKSEPLGNILQDMVQPNKKE